MPYFTRLLKQDEVYPHLSQINQYLTSIDLKCELQLEKGTDDEWEVFDVTGEDGMDRFVVERNPVNPSDEVAEFLDEIRNCKPESAVKWPTEFLPGVKMIFAFQHFDVDRGDGRELYEEIQNCLWGESRAIIQADFEGFSNEDGRHILWQFSDHVFGPWWMAVLRDGRWVSFQMDLGNQHHREAFFRGEVPKGVGIEKIVV